MYVIARAADCTSPDSDWAEEHNGETGRRCSVELSGLQQWTFSDTMAQTLPGQWIIRRPA